MAMLFSMLLMFQKWGAKRMKVKVKGNETATLRTYRGGNALKASLVVNRDVKRGNTRILTLQGVFLFFHSQKHSLKRSLLFNLKLISSRNACKLLMCDGYTGLASLC